MGQIFAESNEETNKPKLKPTVKLIGEDGNIFNLIGIASKALQRADLSNEAKEMKEKVFKSESYEEALAIIMEYCEVE